MAEGERAGAIFELDDAMLVEGERNLLGLWTPRPQGGTKGGMALSMSSGEVEETTVTAPVWRANLPADPGLAALYLRNARESLGASRSKLTAVPTRVDVFVAERLSGWPVDSFSVADAEPARPEDEMYFLLKQVDVGEPAESFGLGEHLATGRASAERVWQDAKETFRAFAIRLQRMVASVAWVETHMGGNLVGLTRLDWSGDMETFIEDRFAPVWGRLHRHNVSIVLETRRTLLCMSALVIASAVKLSVLSTTPIGMVAIFPVALRFINQVRAESRS